jgi:hypothetical protein
LQNPFFLNSGFWSLDIIQTPAGESRQLCDSRDVPMYRADSKSIATKG